MNAAKFLLYEDPLVPLFAADTAGMSFSGFYADLARRYENFSSDSPEFEALYRFYEQLALLLELKCRWRSRSPSEGESLLCLRKAGRSVRTADPVLQARLGDFVGLHEQSLRV